MIFGIGVDTTSVARVAKSMEKETFCQRVFHGTERAMLATLGDAHAAESAAANFAAKEAFLKAVGTGLGGFELHDIAVLREGAGKPYYFLHGTAKDWCRQKGIQCQLSLTHEGGFATAFAILEQTNAAVRPL